MRLPLILLICAGLAGGVARAQDWAFINPLMASSLDVRPGEGGATLFSDHGDPSVATHAIGFHYYESRTGGNAVLLNAGLFRREGMVWVFAGRIEGLLGYGPRDVTFPPGRIEVTTTVLKPGEPRCCPTGVARWSVDRATGLVQRLQ